MRLEAEAEELREEVEDARRTSNLELFFDLVFVFAITQVTSLVLSDKSAAGFGRSTLMLGLVWWAWSGYAWTTTAIDVEGYANRLGSLAGAAGAFFMAFAIPGAFGDEAVWFGCSYFAVRAIQVGLFTYGVRDDRTYLASALRLAPFFLLSPALVVSGAAAGGTTRLALWGTALAIDVVGAAGAHRDAALAGTVLVAFAGVGTLWWAYFDFVARAVERALGRRSGRERGRVARDVFTFAHFPIIAGIVLFAVAAKKVVAHAGDPLSGAGRFALGAAIVTFVLGFAIGRFRLIRKVSLERTAAAAVTVIAVAVLDDLPGVALLGLVVGALAVALVIEAVRLRELRTEIRSSK